MRRKFAPVAVLFLVFTNFLQAQTTFSVQHDTVSSAPALGVSTIIEDGISAATGTVIISWKVIASDFPADWVAACGICDNSACYLATTLWSPASGTLAAETSHPYGISPASDFHMLLEFDNLNSIGCHFLTIRMANASIPVDVGFETYLICNNGTTGTSKIIRSPANVVLYPNPAQEELNIVCEPGLDVKNIIVYDGPGKEIAAYAVVNNSATVNLRNVPPGLYFVRLVNSNGATVVTNKFSRL